MAADLRYPDPALSRRAYSAYADFNVFQLMRLLGGAAAADGALSPRLRFRADLGAAFPGREISRLSREQRNGRSERIVVHTANYCLASELGPLPAPFLEWVREQQREGAGAMPAFLNLFNQRIHTLRYDLKRRSLRALDPAARPEATLHANQLAALIGLGHDSLQKQIPLPPRAWLGLSSLLVNPRRSADVVAVVMSAYLGVKTTLRSLIGAWRNIEAGERLALGRRNHQLGRSSLLGQRMWDNRASVRLEVERLNFAQVLPLLPLCAQPDVDAPLPPDQSAGLAAMLHLLLDRRYDCLVRFKIASASIPRTPLGRQGIGLRLGQTAWLFAHASPPESDSYLDLRIPAYPAMAETPVDALEAAV